MDKLGKPWWVDLSKEVEDWAKAAKKEEPPEIEWTLPADAKTRSFNAKFVDAMLGVGGGVGSPADQLMAVLYGAYPSQTDSFSSVLAQAVGGKASPGALRALAGDSGCSLAFVRADDGSVKLIRERSASSSDFWRTCLLPATFETLDGLKARLGSTLTAEVAVWGQPALEGGDQAMSTVLVLQNFGRERGCVDRFSKPSFSQMYGYDDSIFLSAANTGAYMARLTEALPPSTPSCEDGCPLERPLCTAGSCVTPVCSDFAPLCNVDGNTGFLARAMCSATCGCDDPYSALFFIGEDHGCPRSCFDTRKKEKSLRPWCTDAKSVEDRATLVAFATTPAVISKFSLTLTAAAWEEMGCSAIEFTIGLNTSRGPMRLCDTKTTEFNTFNALCPETCGGSSGVGDSFNCVRPIIELSGKALALANAANVASWNLDPEGLLKHGPLTPEMRPKSCKDLDLATCRNFEIASARGVTNPCQATCVERGCRVIYGIASCPDRPS
jgi:hypothetical protein